MVAPKFIYKIKIFFDKKIILVFMCNLNYLDTTILESLDSSSSRLISTSESV